MGKEPQGIYQHRAEENSLASVLVFMQCRLIQIYVGTFRMFEAKCLTWM
jgi:hypothetical protein